MKNERKSAQMKGKERMSNKNNKTLKLEKITKNSIAENQVSERVLVKKRSLQEKGITLIALVVTIIILLILAGVTLNMALSQNGLFSKTQEAADKYKQAQSDEEFEIEKIEYAADGKDIKEIKTISNEEDFKNFRDSVNSGDNFENTLIKLTDDLDLGNEEWTPIGTTENPFDGVFNGNGHKINNLKLGEVNNDFIGSNNTKCVGLFGINKGIVENVGIETGNITSTGTSGAIIGESSGIVRNCYNKAQFNCTIKGNIGGIVGLLDIGGIVECCYNEGNMTCRGNSDFCAIAGIVGFSTWPSKISKCYNKGKLSLEFIAMNERVGGISCGQADVISCYNRGDLKISEGEGANGNWETVGGIIGHDSSPDSTIRYCYNTGSLDYGERVSENKRKGGVIGFGSCTVDHCLFLNNCDSGAGKGTNTNKMKFESFSDSDDKDTLLEKLGSDFTKDEKVINDGYPILKWQAGK